MSEQSDAQGNLTEAASVAVTAMMEFKAALIECIEKANFKEQ
jgi:hypothetical protein